MMEKPAPKHEIYVQVISDYLVVTVESRDMAQRLESEAGDFGTINHTQGITQEMRNTQAGFVPTTVTNESYGITIRPSFDPMEVAKYLGRGGCVEVFMPDESQETFYYPEGDND